MDLATLETKLLLALFLPGLLVVFFTRVTFHHIVGLVLTIALIAASVYAGYTHTWILYVADALSLTVGFWYATRMVKRARKQGQDEDEVG
ncbi:CsbA family protein [Sporosarcina sp. Sa2YVA2]|uniref:CsbA family protein n=1 Tax=Sporosarcina quadrami TaxID=2762234 RepID=A0ABR8UAS2_9BACL|nr:CsbA family protein [Sporosarcina quadrami]MBD7985128.1 CsbA family protein [Sporosarcina quadrami]